MWLTSKSPTASRTALCSSMMPEYCTGMSQPPKSTIFAPSLRCVAFRGVAFTERLILATRTMNIADWDARYRAGEGGTEPTRLVMEAVAGVVPGKALDLACGAGRNSIYLARMGWQMTAVDGAEAAIEILNRRSAAVQTVVANLEDGSYRIEPESWDLVLSCYYLYRDLFGPIKEGVRPGGLAVAIVHTPAPGEEPNEKRAGLGELRTFFEGWGIEHYYEGVPRDDAHKRNVAEIVARKPGR